MSTAVAAQIIKEEEVLDTKVIASDPPSSYGWGGTEAVATFGWGEDGGAPVPVIVSAARGGGGIDYVTALEEEKEWGRFIKKHPRPFVTPTGITIQPLGTETETEIVDLRPALLERQIEKNKEMIKELDEKRELYKKDLEDLQKMGVELDLTYTQKREELETMLELVQTRYQELMKEIESFEKEKQEWEAQKKIVRWDNWVGPTVETAAEVKEKVVEVPKPQIIYVQPQSNFDIAKVAVVVSAAVITVAAVYYMSKMFNRKETKTRTVTKKRAIPVIRAVRHKKVTRKYKPRPKKKVVKRRRKSQHEWVIPDEEPILFNAGEEANMMSPTNLILDKDK